MSDLHVTHFARVQVARVIRLMADEATGAVDMLLARHWLSAAADAVLTLKTGRTAGEWVSRGLNKFADEIQAAEAQGTSIWDMTAALHHAQGATALRVWRDEVIKDMEAEGGPYVKLKERGPSEPRAFAAWAVQRASALGMTLEAFLLARHDLGV